MQSAENHTLQAIEFGLRLRDTMLHVLEEPTLGMEQVHLQDRNYVFALRRAHEAQRESTNT